MTQETTYSNNARAPLTSLRFVFLLLTLTFLTILLSGSAYAAGDPSGSLTTSDVDPRVYSGQTSTVAPPNRVGPNPYGSGKVYLSDANNSTATTPFYEYDVATDTWTTKASLPAPNSTQIAVGSSGNVYALPEDGMIYRYDPLIDSWVFVIPGPIDAIGNHAISMFAAHNGEFYWGDDGTTALYYTSGGIWNVITTPRAISSASSIDRATGRIHIRSYNQLGFFSFDTASLNFPVICDDLTSVSENSRAGSFYGVEFFTRTWFGNYIGKNVNTCLSRDSLVAPTSIHTSSAEDLAGNIYSGGYSPATSFDVYNVPNNILITLAPSPWTNHSTIVATPGVAPGGPPYCVISVNQSIYFSAEVISLSTLSVVNPGAAPVRVKLKAWVHMIKDHPLKSYLKRDKRFRDLFNGTLMPPNSSVSLAAPVDLHRVRSDSPFGTHSVNCRLLDGLTLQGINLDQGVFDIF